MANANAPDTSKILEELKDESIKILATALGSKTLVPFETGALGNYPFNWQNSLNVSQNNKLNYDWITKNIVQAGDVTSQGESLFTNQYLELLLKIGYAYSVADQSAVNKANTDATNQASALQNSWRAAFGALPTPSTGTETDAILSIIQTQWASKQPTSLMDIQQSFNLNQLLDLTPASGKQVLPTLTSYLNAINSAIPLVNSSSANTGYLAAALRGIQDPSPANGAVSVAQDGGTATLSPSYGISPQMSETQNALASIGNNLDLAMTVQRTTSDQYTVSVSGNAGFDIPILSLFSMSVSGSASYFQDKIATTDNKVEMTLTYPGVNLVNFGPTAFSQVGKTSDWYWLDPVTEAIANEGKDVTGFKFSPTPPDDFSANGKFGYLEGVAIAGYPTVVIKVTSSSYSSIETEIKQSATVSASFLGIPLGSSTESTYSNSLTTNSSEQSVTITMSPPPELVGGTANNSTAWILGAVKNFPAS
jgi:hypothetical protein